MDRGYSGIGRSLSISASRFPDRPALIEVDGLSLTYRQLNQGANAFAHYLLACGLGKGNHIAMLSENSLDHVVALYGVAKIGGVAVVLDPKWTPAEVARALDFFDCRVLIVDSALSDKLAAADLGILDFGVIKYEREARRCALIEMTRDLPNTEPGIAVLDHDVFTLMLTSGTTGMPKGCIRTHRNVEMGCINGAMGKALDDGSRELVVVPIYYGNGRGSIMGQVFVGGTTYVMPAFDPERMAALIESENIASVGLAPTMCNRLLKVPHLERYDFSSLRVLRKAGSPFTLAMVEELRGRVTENIFQGYASTESGGVTMLKPADQVRKLGSSGRPRWGVEIEIVSGDGEIRVRGPNVCEGYYKNPDEQRRVFRDGWYYTGDLGHIDEEGYLYVTGRKKDLIKTGSINVSPREVENTVLLLAGIEDVAVVGVPDPEWGEAVKAFIVLKPDATLSEADVKQHCRQTLAGYKVPKQVEFISQIERNTLGKLTKDFISRLSGAST